MSLKSVPSQGPLRVVLIMCPTCGQVVLPTLTKARHGVSQIVFYHTNKEMGCAWKNSSSMERATGETLGLKESVRMGNDGKGQPLMVNEYELADRKSFDISVLEQFGAPDYVIGVDVAAAVTVRPQLTERTTEPPQTAVPAPSKPPIKFTGPTGTKASGSVQPQPSPSESTSTMLAREDAAEDTNEPVPVVVSGNVG